MVEHAIEAGGLSCRRRLGRDEVSRVEGVTLDLACHEPVVVTGEDGCGRNLLVNLLGLLVAPESGSLRVFGRKVDPGDQGARNAVRDREFGFIFPAPYLLPEFSVAENVAVPLFKLRELETVEAGERTIEVMEQVGLAGMEEIPAGHLDLYDQYLVSLARAMATRPRVLVLENAGAHLEDDAFTEFVKTLVVAANANGCTILASCAPSRFPVFGDIRRIEMSGGRVTRDERTHCPIHTP